MVMSNLEVERTYDKKGYMAVSCNLQDFNNHLIDNVINLRSKRNYQDYSDTELLNFFLINSDELAFNEIFHRYYHKVRRLALKMLNDVEDAEDITQEVFVNLLTSAGSFRGESKFSTWIYAVTLNSIRMRFRGLKKHKTSISIEDDRYNNSIESTISIERSISHDPESISIDRELIEKLYEALELLTKESKEVLLLRVTKHYTNLEIARKLGITLSAAKSRVHRARQSLEKTLK